MSRGNCDGNKSIKSIYWIGSKERVLGGTIVHGGTRPPGEFPFSSKKAKLGDGRHREQITNRSFGWVTNLWGKGGFWEGRRDRKGRGYQKGTFKGQKRR